MEGSKCYLLATILFLSPFTTSSLVLDDTPVPLSNSAFATAGLYHTENTSGSTTENSSSICQPKHIHIANGEDPWNSMTVSFSTSCQPEDASFSISYGFDPFDFEYWVLADPDEHMTTYSHTQRTNNESVFYESDYIYHVPLKELRDSRRYFYQINVEIETSFDELDDVQSSGSLYPPFDKMRGTDAYHRDMKMTNENNLQGHVTDITSVITHPSLSSSLFYFTTAPLPGKFQNNDGDPIKIAVVADLGQTYNSSMTMYHMLLESEGYYFHGNDGVKASLAICTGDMSYADSNQTRWDTWFNLISPLVSRLPFMVAPGNHEVESDAVTKESFVAYENRFAMPKVRNAKRGCIGGEMALKYALNMPCESHRYDYGNSYYAFTYGTARIIMTNCYSNTTKGSVQYNFILNELQNVNRTVTPWLFVATHCPIYNTFKAHQNETQTLQMQEALEPLFVKYRVNIVFAGHTHGYMISKNVRFGFLDEKAPVYVIVGEGGNREGHVKHYLNDEEAEEWVEIRDNKEFGFGTVELLNKTHVKWKWIRNEDVDVAFVSHEYYIENQVFL